MHPENEEDENGKFIGWFKNGTATKDYGVFTELPTMWVGWLTSGVDINGKNITLTPHVMNCILHNSSYDYTLSFSGGKMRVGTLRG